MSRARSRRRLFAGIDLFWEIPLAILSVAFFELSRWTLQSAMRLPFVAERWRSDGWKVLSQPLLDTPLALARIMTTGPRWNPHAVVAGIGPFEVTRSVAVEEGRAAASTESWTAVVHAFPGRGIVASLNSGGETNADGWQQVDVGKGKFHLFLRYYGCTDTAELPAIKVDGKLVGAHRPLPPEVNSFYTGLTRRENLFYRCLAYHVYTLLRLRRFLPESMVEKRYLPVGNPCTAFQYGLVRRGHRLEVEAVEELFQAHRVYLTIYDRASFPVAWHEVESSPWRSPNCRQDGFFLLRIHSRSSTVRRDLIADSIRVRLLPSR